jgi:hypothetical protein
MVKVKMSEEHVLYNILKIREFERPASNNIITVQ